jgi:hypothetical protein
MGTLLLVYDELETRYEISYISFLDPKRKLEYFRSVGWEENWINTVHEIVVAKFEQGYSLMKKITQKL